MGVNSRGLPRRPRDVAPRCRKMRELREAGYYLKEIAILWGMNHSTVIYHVNKKCKCEAE